jgi:hypothetical protein
MNLNRNVVVPVTALVMFGIGCGISALIALAWKTMPPAIWWAIPAVLVAWYLVDVVRREKPSA